MAKFAVAACHPDLRLVVLAPQLGVPAQVFASTQKDGLRKPERGMWDFFVEHGNEGVNPGALVGLGHGPMGSTGSGRDG